MYSVEEALAKLLPNFKRLDSKLIGLERAFGRVLAEDVVADHDLPPFPNSSMDGYAVRAVDVQTSGVELKVIGDIPAGTISSLTVKTGQAIRIMTGAPMPRGADAVVPVEDTDSTDQLHMAAQLPATVRIMVPVKSGVNVRLAGEDIQRASIVLNAGRVLRASDIGVLAGLGQADVVVVRRPRVAIISTGDELVEVDEPLPPGKIRDMNSYALAASVLGLGARPLWLGIARDTEAQVAKKLKQAVAEGAHLILTSAGVSVGAFDVVKNVVSNLGGLDFWRVNVRPGKPLAVGQVEGVPFIGLPGNPVSAMVTFDLFARPAICVMAGRHWRLPLAEAITVERITSDGRRSYLRVTVETRDGALYARTTGSQGSNLLTSMVLADGLLIIPEDVTEVPPGTRLKVRLFEH